MADDSSKKLFVEKVRHSTYARPFSIHQTIVNPNSEYALYLHCHPEMELFYLDEGDLDFYIEDRVYYLKEGSAMFIPPGLLHSALKKYGTKCSFHAVVFSRDMILMDELPPYCERYFTPVYVRPYECIKVFDVTVTEPENESVLNLIRHVISFINTNVRECELSIRGALLMIWQSMYNMHIKNVQNNSPSPKAHSMMIECFDYIKEHYNENITLADLSYRAGMSEGHFCRVFKDLTGFSPFNYINRLRISKSLELLTDTDKKISEIASICGYNNISYFNRTFGKTMHESPSEYRRHFF